MNGAQLPGCNVPVDESGDASVALESALYCLPVLSTQYISIQPVDASGFIADVRHLFPDYQIFAVAGLQVPFRRRDRWGGSDVGDGELESSVCADAMVFNR